MISVIIAVWNQGEKIQENFLNLVNILKKTGDNFEVIFADDGSTDKTAMILRGFQQNYPYIKIINLKHRGQHLALFEGFKIAKGDFVITMDADQKVGPKYIPVLLNELNKGHDIAVAWRASRPGLSLIRQWASSAVNNYTNFITGKRLHDHSCCLKAFKGEFIRNNLSRPELNKFFSILIARYAKSISEIKAVCSYKKDKDSASSFKDLFMLLSGFISASFSMQLKTKC